MIAPAALSVAALALAALFPSDLVPAVSTPARAELAAADDLPDLVARVRSGVIRVEVEGCGERSVGSGFLIAPRLVATVEHVVEGAARIELRSGGRSLGTATVIGSDAARDLALLRTSKPLHGHLFRVARRAPRLGEAVVALGYPLGLPLTVTRGTVSGTNRAISIDGVRRRHLVQTDAALNPGNSGGPLLALPSGEIVGLIDTGSLSFNGIGFAVSAQVARPLLHAWQVAPQPVALRRCAIPSPPSSAAEPASGVDSPYTGRFTSVDRLQRCTVSNTAARCTSGPSGKGVRLVVGSGASYLGITGSSDNGGPSMPMGTSFRTPDETIECTSSTRGITCTDLMTGRGFTIGDQSIVIQNGGSSPRSYSGYFSAVDRLERCYADDFGATCTAGPSGKGVQLTNGTARYLGVTGSTDRGGPALPEGDRFRTPGGRIECASSSRGVNCTDTTTGNGFTIGDHYVELRNGGGVQRR